MNTLIETLHNHAKKIFVLSYIFILVIFFTVNFFELPLIDGETSVKINTFGILFTLLTIPLSLKGYAKSIESIRQIGVEDAIVAKYKKAGIIRVFLLSSAVCINIVIYGFTQDPSMIVCALIPLASTFFCIPSKKRTFVELMPEEKSEDEDAIQGE